MYLLLINTENNNNKEMLTTELKVTFQNFSEIISNFEAVFRTLNNTFSVS